MHWLERLRKSGKYKIELTCIDEEISRSKRFGFQFAVLVLELKHSVPRGLSKLLPGQTLSFHILRKNLRLYDKVIDLSSRRYHIILPQTDRQGTVAVKNRVLRLSQMHSWGEIKIGVAVFPEDGETPNLLLTKASELLPVLTEPEVKPHIQLTERDRVLYNL